MEEKNRHEGLCCSSMFDNEVTDLLLGLTNIIMSIQLFYHFYQLQKIRCLWRAHTP